MDFEPFDAPEFSSVCGDEGCAEAASLRGDEEVEGSKGLTGRLQHSTDLGVMKGGVQVEVGKREETQEGFESTSVMRMGLQIFLHSGPEFGCDDDGNSRQGWIRQLLEPGTITEHGGTDAGIKEKG